MFMAMAMLMAKFWLMPKVKPDRCLLVWLNGIFLWLPAYFQCCGRNTNRTPFHINQDKGRIDMLQLCPLSDSNPYLMAELNALLPVG